MFPVSGFLVKSREEPVLNAQGDMGQNREQ